VKQKNARAAQMILNIILYSSKTHATHIVWNFFRLLGMGKNNREDKALSRGLFG